MVEIIGFNDNHRHSFVGAVDAATCAAAVDAASCAAAVVAASCAAAVVACQFEGYISLIDCFEHELI
ncbi:hypothetical protein ACFX15_012672 [Malus domestica]